MLRLSADRLAALEDALPVASHFAATLNDLRAWLDEISAEIRSIDVPHSSSSEQLRKLLEGAKVLSSMELIMAALRSRCRHYNFYPVVSFFRRLISAVADWMSTIL